MAIKARDQIKWTTSATSLTLEADTGEAFLVKDIHVGGALNNYTTITIDKTTVGYIRSAQGYLGNHIHFQIEDNSKVTLLRYLMDKGIFKGYPVAEGQKFIVNPGSSMSIAIIYDIYEPGDISADMENGSEAKEYMLINYGRAGTSGYLANGDNEYDISILPSEFPNFPFGKDVPAKTAVEIYGILASDLGKTSDSAANKQYTKYIKLIKEREVLFDEDKLGLVLLGSLPTSDNFYIGAGISIVGNFSDNDYRLPFMLSAPLRFSAGEELTVILNTQVSAGSPNIPVDKADIAFIEKVIRTG